MRVIAGKYRGSVLHTKEGLNTRPTLDNVKESMFNILNFKIYDSNVLDLFSGSGSLGIEAITRGAKHVVFNDYDKEAFKYINENLKRIKITESYETFNLDYKECLKRQKIKFDIVLLDPPYKQYVYMDILNYMEENELLNPYAYIMFECEKEFKMDEINDYIIKEYKYGKKKLILLKRQK